MSCGDVDALSQPRIIRKRLLWADWIPEAAPVEKNFSNPLCLKLRIILCSVTYYVSGYKGGLRPNTELSCICTRGRFAAANRTEGQMSVSALILIESHPLLPLTPRQLIWVRRHCQSLLRPDQHVQRTALRARQYGPTVPLRPRIYAFRFLYQGLHRCIPRSDREHGRYSVHKW